MNINSNNSMSVFEEFAIMLKENPDNAYDYKCQKAYELSKYELTDIIKELLYGVWHHLNNKLYQDEYYAILSDVSDELANIYKE